MEKRERLSAQYSVKYKKTFYFCPHKHKELNRRQTYAKLTSNISSNLSRFNPIFFDSNSFSILFLPV
jgi:hypothetical protein